MITTLRGPECSIRTYRRGDGPLFHEAAMESVGHVQPWMPWCGPAFTLENAEAWVEAKVQSFADRAEFEFVIVDGAGALVGGCGLNQIDPTNRRANLGYWIRRAALGRGYAAAAVTLLGRWAHVNTDLERLELVVAVGNFASVRVAERAGAGPEGVLRNRLRLHGVFHDAVMFALIRGENMAG